MCTTNVLQASAQTLASPAIGKENMDSNVDSNQNKSDLMDKSTALSLANIRGSLIRQEDTIIFSLIERAQFSLNSSVYEEGMAPVSGLMADAFRKTPRRTLRDISLLCFLASQTSLPKATTHLSVVLLKLFTPIQHAWP